MTKTNLKRIELRPVELEAPERREQKLRHAVNNHLGKEPNRS
jgi:hypothetical protein